MLTTSVRVKLIAFVVIALSVTTYAAATYVGINPLKRGYTFSVALPEAGGLFENGEVTYRGVPVGRVDSLRPTQEGAIAVLRIDADAPDIPASVTAAVANRSSIGEQYLDLRAESMGGEVLTGGEMITVRSDGLPPDLHELLRSGRDFVSSVPEDDLGTVIDEAYEATRGTSEHIRRLVDTSLDYVRTAERNFLVTRQLIENSQIVLTTQEAVAEDLINFSGDFKLIAETIESSDADLRTLIANTPGSANEVRALFESVGTPLGILMANLVTPAQIFGIHSDGVEDALYRLPEAMSIGWAVNGSKGVSMSLAQTYFAPLPCTTGYEGTTLRPGQDASDGPALNLKAGCRSGAADSNVRGPKAVPGATISGAVPAKVTNATSLADLMGGP